MTPFTGTLQALFLLLLLSHMLLPYALPALLPHVVPGMSVLANVEEHYYYQSASVAAVNQVNHHTNRELILLQLPSVAIASTDRQNTSALPASSVVPAAPAAAPLQPRDIELFAGSDGTLQKHQNRAGMLQNGARRRRRSGSQSGASTATAKYGALTDEAKPESVGTTNHSDRASTDMATMASANISHEFPLLALLSPLAQLPMLAGERRGANASRAAKGGSQLLTVVTGATEALLNGAGEGGNASVVLICVVFAIAVALVGGAVVCLAMSELQHPNPERGSPPPRLSVPPPVATSSGRESAMPPPRVPLSSEPKLPPESSPAAPPASAQSMPPTGAQGSLCPSLVVPSGAEFVFAVREAITRFRQDLTFNIVDLKGTPLSRVVIAETGTNQKEPSIFLQTMLKMPLASVNTSECYAGESNGPLTICRSNGLVFGRLQKEIKQSDRYVIKHRAGRPLLTFHGDFKEKAVNVMSSTGQLVGATEKCVLDFDAAPHYQVRVAPNTDAGLVICGLLAIDKLEGGRT